MISSILNLLAILLLLWYFLILFLSFLGCTSARRYRSPASSSSSSTVSPPVSILRPLKGLDSNLYENLQSSFTQSYPIYEIILSVASPSDQALPVARDLIAKYPHVPASLIIGDQIVGTNPKINNLIRPYHQAKYDILWVLDSNILIPPGSLSRAVHALTASSQVGLVHHLPFASAFESALGSTIEEAFLNTNHAKMYLAINTLSIDSCVIGKSNMFRRSDVEKVSGDLKPIKDGFSKPGAKGLPAFGRFLAEDNMLASALWHELGLRHHLSTEVVQNAIGNMSFLIYIQRRIRWIRVRKYMNLPATFLEPLTECFLLSVLASTAVFYLFNIGPWLFMPLHYVLWILVDLNIYKSLAGNPLPSSRRLSFFLAWALRELLAFPIWFVAMMSDKIVWRDVEYTVLKHGEAISKPLPVHLQETDDTIA